MKDEMNETVGELPTVSGPRGGPKRVSSVNPPQIAGYEILGQLGEAGQGRIWRAVQLSTHREVALKMPHMEFLTSGKTAARFEREVELTARLNHPNIARIYDSGMCQGVYYYAMELIEGVPLDQYVQAHELGHTEIVRLMVTVCEAVQHAHQNRVIHRDIKPSNILITDDGQPHVVDFGLAMSLAAADPLASVSVDGEVTGTPAYMSPEQAAGHHEQLDTRTDVYSLGVVLYRLLTGGFPYDVRTSMLQTLRNIRETEPIRPSTIMRTLDRDLEAIVLKALIKEPARRYQSVPELKHDMQSWLAGLPVLAQANSSLYLLRKLMGRHRYTSTVVALMLAIVVGFSCISLQLYVRLRRANTGLETAVQSLQEEVEEWMNLAGERSIGRFLRAWHENRPDDAASIALFFGRGTREAKTAAFLLDSRPLDEKVDEFRRELGETEPRFAEFALAEHLLRDDKLQEARESYRACLTYAKYADEDEWLTMWVESRLYQLMAHNQETENRTNGRE